MSNIPKAVLYYSPSSVWSSAVLLTLVEKGYGDDELDLKIVNLARGENFGPSYLRLNLKASVPTLVVPLQKTLSEDVESRYKPITETSKIVEFLDKSRSASSHTNTTSRAPAPSLAPATVAFSAISKSIIEDLLHSDSANPTTLAYMNAKDDASLRAHADLLTSFLKGKHVALTQYLADAASGEIHVSEKVQAFWKTKKEATEILLSVAEKANIPNAELDADAKARRRNYLDTAKSTWEVDLPKTVSQLNGEMIGPYVLGEQFSLADVHLAAWLTSVVHLSGGTAADDGTTAISKLEKRMGGGLVLPKKAEENENKNKLAVFWEAMKERASWKKVYANGLH